MEKRLEPRLENQMERAVIEVINDIVMMETQHRFCICDKFRTDVAALALNHLQPRYATSFQGSLHTLEEIQSDQDLQVLIRKQVAMALDRVVQDPRCDQEDCPILRNQIDVDLELVPESENEKH